jgi:hypothetical protein
VAFLVIFVNTLEAMTVMEPTTAAYDNGNWVDSSEELECLNLSPPFPEERRSLTERAQCVCQQIVAPQEENGADIRSLHPSLAATALEQAKQLPRSIAQANIHVPISTLQLVGESLAAAALTGVGAASLGVSPEIIPAGVILGGLTAYGARAFRGHWDSSHRIAAAVTLPVAALTLTTAIGPGGVVAVTLAAGAYGPELCTKVADVAANIFGPERGVEVQGEQLAPSTQQAARGRESLEFQRRRVMSLLGSLGLVGLGVAGWSTVLVVPRLIPIASAIGVAAVFGWDNVQRIAAAVTLPVAYVTLSTAIGPVGVAAVTVAAGAYGHQIWNTVQSVGSLVAWRRERTT